MKIQTLLLVLFAATLLPGCVTTEDTAQPLILTCEDRALMRKPYTPCPGEGCRVDCCK